MTLEFLFYLNFYKAPQGWIRTAAALSQKTAQKQPGGLFLAARLAASTRAHQEIQYPNRVLDFLFYGGFLGAEQTAGIEKPGTSRRGSRFLPVRALPKQLFRIVHINRED